MTNWFADCWTKDEVKSRYRELALKWHPDKPDGDTAVMQSVNVAYSIAMAMAVAKERPGYSAQEVQDEVAVHEMIRQAVEVACGLPNVEVIIRGAWVWVHGDTKPVKETLKANGFRWAKKKPGQPWFYAGVKSANRGRQWSIEEIEDRYGAKHVKRREQSVRPGLGGAK